MAETQLKEAIKKQGLSDFQELVLERFALEARGVDKAAAADWISLQTDKPAFDCNEAIADLGFRQLLIEVANEDRSEVRLVANYSQLGLSEQERFSLQSRSQLFEFLDFAHSPKAMSTLQALLEEEPEELFIVLAEATNRKFFRGLEERARKNRKTTFLIPKQTAIPSQRRRVYQQELDDWIRFFKEDKAFVRNIRFLVTPKPYKHLYTSTLGQSYVRYDVFETDDKSTKLGTMIRVPKGVSLYELVYKEYCEAVYYACPCSFRLWPFGWLKRTIGQYSLVAALMLLAVAFSFVLDGTVVAIIVGALIGVAGNALYDKIRSKSFDPPELY